MTDLLQEFLGHIVAFDSNHPLLFTSLYFWVFFAAVLLVLALIGGSRCLLRNAFLFAVSIFFYYKTSGAYTLLLATATTITYAVGLALGRHRSRWLLAIGIVSILAVLGYYKYAYLTVDLINSLAGTQWVVRDVVAEAANQALAQERFSIDFIWLPVGISFYTFQCISYLMDIFRRRIEPLTNFLDYGFYVSFFPQLVAGPIVRANEFVGQLHRPTRLSRRWFGLAVFWCLNGLAKKIILADYLAVNFADRVFANPSMFGPFENFAALFVYSLQVYADFSGYTDIAIGVALAMGFHLPQNFNAPYKATNCANFWKRWHISLSKWLQDYLYIPLGGNRRASFGTFCVILTIATVGTLLSGSIYVAVAVACLAALCAIWAIVAPNARKDITSNVNRMNTMLLGGLWHGASWNFMIWGGLNGAGMLIFRGWRHVGIHARAITTLALTAAAYYGAITTNAPILWIATFWLGITALGSSLRALYNLCRLPWQLPLAERAWAIAQTFTFITFTRLFFRAGSNLNPAEANEIAWETASTMVNQIGQPWNIQQIPDICAAYANIFIVFALGMIIHWIPDRTKRRYRLRFAALPIPIMAIVATLAVLIIFQFLTADLQKFIYFQF